LSGAWFVGDDEPLVSRVEEYSISKVERNFPMSARELASGDFTGLASNYSQARPDYSPQVLSGLLGLHEVPTSNLDVVDVGAGTGIWTRMVASRNPRSIRAVEPNDDMRMQGINDSANCTPAVTWSAGTGEQTGVASSSADWVTMASSFHWVDFDAGTAEFARILKPGGWFTALWNPRIIDKNPLLVEIEERLRSLNPGMQRRSSGRSGVTADLAERLEASPHFGAVVYMESHHVIQMSVERYVTAWRSVNDVQVQLGREKFESFLHFVGQRLAGVDSVDATYLTRAWSARVE